MTTSYGDIPTIDPSTGKIYSQFVPDTGGGSASFPPGGSTGEALVKKSGADDDVEWKTLIPSDIGAMPAPSAPDDGDVPTWDDNAGEWVAAPAGGGGGGGLPPMQGGPIAGCWLTQQTGTPIGEGLTPGRILVAPYPIHREVTIDALDCHISADNAGATIDLYIFESDENGLPVHGAHVAVVTGVDASAKGQAIGVLPAPVTLPPGMYWTGAQRGSTGPTVLCANGALSARVLGAPIYLTGALDQGGSSNYSGYWVRSGAIFSVRYAPIVRVRAE